MKRSKRKLPGPIGLLPEEGLESNSQDFTKCFHKLKQSRQENTEEHNESDSTSSQELCPDLWKEMCSDLDFQTENSECLIYKYNVQWLKHNVAYRKCNTWRTPFLCAAIKVIDTTEKDASVILGDQSGEVNGIICEAVLEKYGNWLHPGSILVLQQISVLCPKSNLRKPYLNITLSCLMRVYGYDLHTGALQFFKLVDWDENRVKTIISEAEHSRSKIFLESDLSPTPKYSNTPYKKVPSYQKTSSLSHLHISNLSATSNQIPANRKCSNIQPFPTKPYCEPVCEKPINGTSDKWNNSNSSEVSKYSLSSMLVKIGENRSSKADPVSNFLDSLDEDDLLLASLDTV